MSPWVSPDTPSWLAPCFDSSCLGSPRFPLYGPLVRAIGEGTLPWLQDGALILGAWALADSLSARGASARAALAIGLAPLFSMVLPLWGRAVLPDCFAQAAMLGALAATIRPRLLLAVVLGALSYLLKPSFLPFIVALPALAWLLGLGWQPALRLLLGLAAPFLLIAGLRLALVNDFNLVSFGGFQMAGMAAEMLTPATIERLPDALRADAQEILARRDALVADGRLPPIPLNSTGQRSFPSVAAGYFDMLARTYDIVLYDAVRPTQRADESWVSFNRRLQRLSLAILRAEPLDYLAWLFGAKARLAGHLLVFNPGIAVAFILLVAGAFRRRRAAPSDDLWLLVWPVAIFTLGASALSVLVTFPAARYIDGAGMLIAAIPIYWGLTLLCGEQPGRELRQIGQPLPDR